MFTHARCYWLPFAESHRARHHVGRTMWITVGIVNLFALVQSQGVGETLSPLLSFRRQWLGL